jgi:lysozyme
MMTPLKTSEDARHSLKNEEGYKLVPYICPAGKWTVGVGHRLYPASLFPGITYNEKIGWHGSITPETAEKILDGDLAVAEASVNSHVTKQLNQDQFDALVLFVFNIGGNNFVHSSLLKYINKGEFKAAANEFKRWVHGDHGETIPGLVARRQRERIRFETPAHTA